MLEDALIAGVIQGGTAGIICFMLIKYTNQKLDKLVIYQKEILTLIKLNSRRRR